MRPIVTIGFSHCFIGPIRGPMLLSCWRNVIRPRPTVNIHIPMPQRNLRWGCLANSAEETRFICIGRRTKAVTVGRDGEERGKVISEPRCRDLRPLKTKSGEERDVNKLISPFLLLIYTWSHGILWDIHNCCIVVVINRSKSCLDKSINWRRYIFLHNKNDHLSLKRSL